MPVHFWLTCALLSSMPHPCLLMWQPFGRSDLLFVSRRANTSGGCVAASDMAEVIATSSTFSANSAGSQGAAAWVSGQASLALSSCTVSSNQAPSGAALWTEMRGVVDAQDTTFAGNAARDEVGRGVKSIHVASGLVIYAARNGAGPWMRWAHQCCKECAAEMWL